MNKGSKIILYGKNVCPLCDQAEAVLEILKDKYKFHYEKVDIYKEENLLEEYQLRIPVLVINGEVADEGIFSLSKLDGLLSAIIN